MSWNDIAGLYAQELQTSSDDVHFGVGIPGNKALSLIPETRSGCALDLACGAGENLVALSKLGYSVIGVDKSPAQIGYAAALCRTAMTSAALLCGDMAAIPLRKDLELDVILSVGAAHFCEDLTVFIEGCAHLSRPGTLFILSLPHAVEMIAGVKDAEDGRTVTIDSYFPPNNEITGSHYWRRFAGRIDVIDTLREFVWRPSDVINRLVAAGFVLGGMYEPAYVADSTCPCVFRNPDVWHEEIMYRRVPQYQIFAARFGRPAEDRRY